MINLIIESMKSGYLDINAIRYEGAEVDLEGLLEVLAQENIEIVLINIGQ